MHIFFESLLLQLIIIVYPVRSSAQNKTIGQEEKNKRFGQEKEGQDKNKRFGQEKEKQVKKKLLTRGRDPDARSFMVKVKLNFL